MSSGARPRKYRTLVVHLAGDATESIPVPVRFQMPDLEASEFITIRCADGSTVVLRVRDILRMHLKVDVREG